MGLELIALSGPPCAGKTRVGRELERRGYLFIDFCDIIKQEAARALTYLGVPTTVEDIRANKDRYRQFLQVLGDQIGFNHDPRFVEQSLNIWRGTGKRAVFDNVRTPEQFETLRPYSFRLVRLEAPVMLRFGRAHERYGVELADFLVQETHPIESGRGLQPHIALTLDASQPVDALVERLLIEGVLHGTPSCVS